MAHRSSSPSAHLPAPSCIQEVNCHRYETLAATDARTLMQKRGWLYTTPNSSYIPFFHAEVIDLQPFFNGKYGLQDYIVHPQMYFAEYPWIPCIARRPQNAEQFEAHRLHPLWIDDHLYDWEVLPVHAFQERGVMNRAKWDTLAHVVRDIEAVAEPLSLLKPPTTFSTTRRAMLNCLQRLLHLPMSKRDFVLQKAQCQRLALDVDAMSTFLRRFHAREPPVRSVGSLADQDLMGCFTTNPAVADLLLDRGIPLWFVRSEDEVPAGTIRVVSIVHRWTQSPQILEAPYYDYTLPAPEQVPVPFASIGYVGHEVQRVTLLRTMGRHFSDLVRLPSGPPAVVSADQQDPAHPVIQSLPFSAPTPIPARSPSPYNYFDTIEPFPRHTPSPPPQSRYLPSSCPTPVRSSTSSPALKTIISRTSTAGHTPKGIVKPKKKPKGKRAPHNKNGNVAVAKPPQANRSKWVPSVHPLMPKHSPLWSDALSLVDHSLPIHSALSKADMGYMYPDPGMLTAFDTSKRLQAITAWLSISLVRRSQVLGPLEYLPPPLSAGRWREFFWLVNKHNFNPGQNVLGAADDKVTSSMETLVLMFGREDARRMNLDVTEVHFHGTTYPVIHGAAVGLMESDIRRVLWELAEMNWRYELLALDRVAANGEWSKTDADIDRKCLVERVFKLDSSVAVTRWPAQESFILHSNNLYRVGTLAHLRHLMLSWPACPASISAQPLEVETPDILPNSVAELNLLMCEQLAIPRILQLERDIRAFYCQSFFQFFGRPPILPLHLPE